MTAHTFDTAVVTAVLNHMNTEHPEDNLLIARAFVSSDVDSAAFTGLDGAGGTWRVTVDGEEREARISWSVPVTERAEIRREIVVLYEKACERLGVTPHNH